MSDCYSSKLMSYEQGLTLLLSQVSAKKEHQQVSIENALGLVLAEDVSSGMNVPPHDNSAMDGYAFNLTATQNAPSHPTEFKLVGRSFAGEPFQGKVSAGECIRIMTGAKLPDTCDTVQMQENIQVNLANPELVSFIKKPSIGANIRRAGEDIKINHQILPKGHKVTAVDIGLLASIGVAEVTVFTPLKVALIATGDELKKPHQTLDEGDIYETNSFALKGMLKKLNVEIIDFGIIPDQPDLIENAFIKADQQADIVISSGGVSVGEADYTKDALDKLGTIEFWKLAIKPGKPFAFGKLKNSVFFGLPGNPVSALVTFYQLAVYGIKKMQGMPHQTRARFAVKCLSELRKSPGRMDFQRGIVSIDNGELTVTSTGKQGSGVLSSIAHANCFIVLAQEQGSVSAGEMVDIEMFDELLK